jgi:hypothetical protein
MSSKDPNDRDLMEIKTMLQREFPQELNTEETLGRLLIDLKDLRALNKGKLADLSIILQALSIAGELREGADDLLVKSEQVLHAAEAIEALCERAGVMITNRGVHIKNLTTPMAMQ